MLNNIMLIVSIAGFLCMTWLFPVLGTCLSIFSKRNRTNTSSLKIPQTIAILLPAYNEEKTIRNTLESIKKAIKALNKAHPNIKCLLRVGIDGSTDRTQEIATSLGAEAFHNFRNIGKWRTLNKLIHSSCDAEWIILADAGVIWHEDFLLKCLPSFTDPQIMSVAPSYRNPDGGFIENISWALEAHLKALESSSGGPVSIHGATIAYRRKELVEALLHLESNTWLNDDVVLPMLLRSLFPSMRIKYASSIKIYDQRVIVSDNSSNRREFGRRRRMVLGNIQWIHQILPAVFRGNFTAGLLSLRRIFRLFWAYWGTFFAAGLLVYFKNDIVDLGVITPILGLILALGMFRYRKTAIKIVDSSFASLLAPYYLFRFNNSERAGWK